MMMLISLFFSTSFVEEMGNLMPDNIKWIFLYDIFYSGEWLALSFVALTVHLEMLLTILLSLAQLICGAAS